MEEVTNELEPHNVNEEVITEMEPQIRKGQRTWKPKREWPEEHFHSKKKKSVGKQEIVVHVDIEPVTLSNRYHDIISTSDDISPLPAEN